MQAADTASAATDDTATRSTSVLSIFTILFLLNLLSFAVMDRLPGLILSLQGPCQAEESPEISQKSRKWFAADKIVLAKK